MARVGCAVLERFGTVGVRGRGRARIVEALHRERLEVERIELVAVITVMPAAPDDQPIAREVGDAAAPVVDDAGAALDAVDVFEAMVGRADIGELRARESRTSRARDRACRRRPSRRTVKGCRRCSSRVRPPLRCRPRLRATRPARPPALRDRPDRRDHPTATSARATRTAAPHRLLRVLHGWRPRCPQPRRHRDPRPRRDATPPSGDPPHLGIVVAAREHMQRACDRDRPHPDRSRHARDRNRAQTKRSEPLRLREPAQPLNAASATLISLPQPGAVSYASSRSPTWRRFL